MTSDIRVQVKVLIRFSYLSASGFNLSGQHQSLDEVAQVLYDPQRLDRRFRYFEALTVPSLVAQSDRDFSTGLLVGRCFPDDALARLSRLVDQLPGGQIVALDPLSNYRAAKRTFARMRTDPAATHVATVRVDDDDAIHSGMIARIRDIATMMIRMQPDRAPFVIGFNKGYFLDLATDPPAWNDVQERTPLGIGLTQVAPVEDESNIYRRNHRKVAQFYDCYTEIAEPMFVRSIHPDNDSGGYASGQHSAAKVTADDVFKSFGVRLDRLKGLT